MDEQMNRPKPICPFIFFEIFFFFFFFFGYGTSPSQGQQLCQIVLKSMHYCTDACTYTKLKL